MLTRSDPSGFLEFLPQALVLLQHLNLHQLISELIWHDPTDPRQLRILWVLILEVVGGSGEALEGGLGSGLFGVAPRLGPNANYYVHFRFLGEGLNSVLIFSHFLLNEVRKQGFRGFRWVL